jgi:hypothetical protein
MARSKNRFLKARFLPLTHTYALLGSRTLVDAAVDQGLLVPIFKSPRLVLFSSNQVRELHQKLKEGKITIVNSVSQNCVAPQKPKQPGKIKNTQRNI